MSEINSVDPATQKLVAEVALRSMADEWRQLAETEKNDDRALIYNSCAGVLERVIEITSPLNVICDYDPRIQWCEGGVWQELAYELGSKAPKTLAILRQIVADDFGPSSRQLAKAIAERLALLENTGDA